jgi:hypothetical protein
VFPHRSETRRGAESDQSDLKHLANCILSGVDAFVTSELAIISASHSLQAKHGLEVLSPQDIVSLTALTRDWEFQPAKVSVGATLSSRMYCEADSDPVSALAAELGVQTSAASEFFGPSTSASRRSRIVVSLGSRVVGFAAHCISANIQAPVRSLLLVREGVSRAQLIVDHLLGGLLSELPRQRLLACDLVTAEPQLLTRATAQRLGFNRCSSSQRGVSIQRKLSWSGVISISGWQSFSRAIASRTGTLLPDVCPSYSKSMSTGVMLRRQAASSSRTISLVSFESTLSPLLLLAEGRPSAIVPIREKQANELLPEVRQQSPLFQKEAGVLIERAYFSRSPAARVITRGSMIVFYISGADGGRAEAVGIARVTSGGQDVRSMNSDLFSQGVLDDQDLHGSSRKSQKIVFFTFESFARFPKALSFHAMKAAGLVGKANLVTVQPLEFGQLLVLLNIAGLIEKPK